MKVKKSNFIFAIILLAVLAVGMFVNTVLACRAVVLMIFAACAVKGVKEKNFINPYFLFLTVPFSLLIYADISRYTDELSVRVWILAILNMVTFILAVSLTPEYKRVDRCIGAGTGVQEKQQALFFTVLSVLPAFYQAVFGTLMPLSSIFSILGAAGVACAVKSGGKKTIIAVVLITVISWMGYVSKSSILMFFIALLVSCEKYYLKTPKQKKKLVLLAGGVLVIMILSFSFANQGRVNGGGQAAVDYYTRYGELVWKGNAQLMMPYMYLTTPWYNLEYVVDTQDVRTFGLWLLKPLLGYLQLDSCFADQYVLEPFSSFNAFGFIPYNFKDFGYLGSCFSTAFIGFFVKKVYSRYKVSRSPFDVACYALTAQAVVEMFFSNHFFTQSYPFTIVIFMGLYKMVFCRKNQVELETDGDGDANVYSNVYDNIYDDAYCCDGSESDSGAGVYADARSGGHDDVYAKIGRVAGASADVRADVSDGAYEDAGFSGAAGVGEDAGLNGTARDGSGAGVEGKL